MEKLIFGNLLCPAVHTLLGKHRFSYTKRMDRYRARTSKDEIRAHQWKKVQALVRYAYDHVPYYKKRFNQASILPEDIRTPTDFAHLPAITRYDVTRNQKTLLSDEYVTHHLRLTASGGSTGLPVMFRANPSHMEYGLASAYQFWKHAGLDLGERCAVLWGEVIDAPLLPRLWVTVSHWLQRRLYLDAYDIRDSIFAEWDSVLRKFKPKALMGYSSALVAFADYYHRNKLTPPELDLVVSQAERLTHRFLIENTFDCRVYDHYGAREAPGLACECPRGNMHQAADICYMEFQHTDMVEDAYSILITPLTLFSMPLLRYEIGDIGIPIDGVCDCGSPLPMIELKYGRLLDVMEIGTKRIHTIVFPHLLKDFPVYQYQVIQTRVDHIIILVRGDLKYTQEIKQQMKKTLAAYFGGVSIEVVDVTHIEKTQTGKYKPVVTLEQYRQRKEYYDHLMKHEAQ